MGTGWEICCSLLRCNTCGSSMSPVATDPAVLLLGLGQPGASPSSTTSSVSRAPWRRRQSWSSRSSKGELGAWQTVAVKRLSKYSTVQEQGDAHREAAACESWQAPGLLCPRGGEDPGVRGEHKPVQSCSDGMDLGYCY